MDKRGGYSDYSCGGPFYSNAHFWFHLQSKDIKRALVNSKFQFDVESFDLKSELKFGNSNKSTNFPLKLQNSILGVSAYLIMSGT